MGKQRERSLPQRTTGDSRTQGRYRGKCSVEGGVGGLKPQRMRVRLGVRTPPQPQLWLCFVFLEAETRKKKTKLGKGELGVQPVWSQ